MVSFLCRTLFTLVMALLPAVVQAEIRALLVGVGDYTVLDADLKGPPSDVALMADVLAARGVTDIRALATGQTVPTRAAIVAAMDRLAADAAPGDTVVFYFSGHGAQAPDASGDEGGGYDEILLPADAAGWKGSIGAVENALLDDELQSWAQGLLGRGVQVVGIIDACHSATGFRAVGGVGVARGLDFADLGIPDTAISVVANEGAPLQGPFVFLYSSQSDQRSFEYPLADGSVWHGAFTLRLAQVLQTLPEATWAQTLGAVSAAMVQEAAQQVPDGEGPLLDAVVFGNPVGQTFMPLRNGRLQAGLLQGLAIGDEVAFYARPERGTALATAPLVKVSAREAVTAMAPPADAIWAEVISPAPPIPLVLGAPVMAEAGDHARWKVALAGHIGGEKPDLFPVLTADGLALTGPDGQLDPAGPGSSPRVVPENDETEGDALDRVLLEAQHSLRLKRLLSGLSGRSLTGKAQLEVSYQRRAAPVDGKSCGPAQDLEPVDPAKGLAPCDQLWIRFTNVSGGALDVSVLYFNADFTVHPVWPQGQLSNRLAPGETARAGLQLAPGLPPALEELMLVAVPTADGGERVDLTRLAKPEKNRTYSNAESGVEIWMSDRMTVSDTKSRGFSTRPPALQLLRQAVRVMMQTP